MRLITLLAGLLIAVTLVLGWTKDDYEIFDLVSELEAAEGKGTNFYSWLGLEPSASKGELAKAYRRKSLELHPDKNPGVKDLQSRFARLGTINEILKSPEKRERYNFFYKNGVPKWRGTGYYYARYRPTLSHTLGFLVFLTSMFHLLVLRLNYSRDRKRVDYFNRSAQTLGKNAAGRRETFMNPSTEGEEEVYGRRVKVPMAEGNDMGGTLDLVIYNEQVYIPHADGYLEPLSDLAIPPSYFHTWPFRLLRRLLDYLVALLPPSMQASLPDILRPHPTTAHDTPTDDTVVEGFEVSAPKSNGSLRHKSSRNGTETPQTATSTDLEDDDEDDDAVDANGANGTEGKKKKRGPGKAGGMRRRKMGMKR